MHPMKPVYHQLNEQNTNSEIQISPVFASSSSTSSSLSYSSANIYQQPIQVKNLSAFNDRFVAYPEPSVFPNRPTFIANNYSQLPTWEQNVSSQQKVGYHSNRAIPFQSNSVEKINILREPTEVCKLKCCQSRISSAPPNSQVNISKPESPLDLSLKTICQYADSTAYDDVENTTYNQHLQNASFPPVSQPIRILEGNYSNCNDIRDSQPYYLYTNTPVTSSENFHTAKNSSIPAENLKLNHTTYKYCNTRHIPPTNYKQNSHTYTQYTDSYRPNYSQQQPQYFQIKTSSNVRSQLQRAVPPKSSIDELIEKRINQAIPTSLKSENSQSDRINQNKSTSIYKPLPSSFLKNVYTYCEKLEKNDRKIETPLNSYTVISPTQRIYENQSYNSIKNETYNNTLPKNVPISSKDSYNNQNKTEYSNEIKMYYNAYNKYDYQTHLSNQKSCETNVYKKAEEYREQIPPLTQCNKVLEYERKNSQHEFPIQQHILPLDSSKNQQHYQNVTTNLSTVQSQPKLESDNPALKRNTYVLDFKNGNNYPVKSDTKLIENVKNKCYKEELSLKPLPPFEDLPIKIKFPSSKFETYSEKKRPESSYKEEKIKNTWKQKHLQSYNKAEEENQYKQTTTVVEFASAHPRIRTKAELKQVLPVKHSRIIETPKLPDKDLNIETYSVLHSNIENDRINKSQEKPTITDFSIVKSEPGTFSYPSNNDKLNSMRPTVVTNVKNETESVVSVLNSSSLEDTFHQRKKLSTREENSTNIKKSCIEAEDVFIFKDNDSDSEILTNDNDNTLKSLSDHANKFQNIAENLEWIETCDDLINQLSKDIHKKRGRKKKSVETNESRNNESDMEKLIKCENNKDIDNVTNNDSNCKLISIKEESNNDDSAITTEKVQKVLSNKLNCTKEISTKSEEKLSGANIKSKLRKSSQYNVKILTNVTDNNLIDSEIQTPTKKITNKKNKFEQNDNDNNVNSVDDCKIDEKSKKNKSLVSSIKTMKENLSDVKLYPNNVKKISLNLVVQETRRSYDIKTESKHTKVIEDTKDKKTNEKLKSHKMQINNTTPLAVNSSDNVKQENKDICLNDSVPMVIKTNKVSQKPIQNNTKDKNEINKKKDSVAKDKKSTSIPKTRLEKSKEDAKSKLLIKRNLKFPRNCKLLMRRKIPNKKKIDPKREKMRRMILRRMTRKSKLREMKYLNNFISSNKLSMITRRMTRQESLKNMKMCTQKLNDVKAHSVRVETQVEKIKETKVKYNNKKDKVIEKRIKNNKQKKSQELSKLKKTFKKSTQSKHLLKNNKIQANKKMKNEWDTITEKNVVDFTRRSLRSHSAMVTNVKIPKKILRKKKSSEKKYNSDGVEKRLRNDSLELQNEDVKEENVDTPSWAEELFKYKYSLRMPIQLINISSPPNWPKNNDTCSSSSSSSSSAGKNKVDSNIINNILKSQIPLENKTAKNFNLRTFNDNVKLLEREFDKKLKEKHENNILTKLMLEKKIKIIPKSSDGPEILPTPTIYSSDSNLSSDFDSSNNETNNSANNDNPANIKSSRIQTDNDIENRNFVKQEISKKEVSDCKNKKLKKITDIDSKILENDVPVFSPLALETIDSSEEAMKNLDEEETESYNNDLMNNEYSINEEKAEEEKIFDDHTNDLKFKSNSKKKNKLIKRKHHSSGFDYIRKKCKKKKIEEKVIKEKEKKKFILSERSTSEFFEDIQNEVKSWVVNKSIGETVLHKAARLGYLDACLYCLEKLHCSPSQTDNAGYTPLHEACTHGHLKIAKLLLTYGADVSASAKGGIRPLHEAVVSGNVELVRLLLSFGADPLLSTYTGQTPLSLIKEDQDDLKQFLLLYLSDIQGNSSNLWKFNAVDNLDPEINGYDPMNDSPPPLNFAKAEETDFLEFEISDQALPSLYKFKNECDYWVLSTDLPSEIRDMTIKHCNKRGNSQFVVRKISQSDFEKNMECVMILENKYSRKTRSNCSLITLIKYNDELMANLNIQKLKMSFS